MVVRIASFIFLLSIRVVGGESSSFVVHLPTHNGLSLSHCECFPFIISLPLPSRKRIKIIKKKSKTTPRSPIANNNNNKSRRSNANAREDKKNETKTHVRAFVCRRISREGNWSTCAMCALVRAYAFILIVFFEIAFDEGGCGHICRANAHHQQRQQRQLFKIIFLSVHWRGVERGARDEAWTADEERKKETEKSFVFRWFIVMCARHDPYLQHLGIFSRLTTTCRLPMELTVSLCPALYFFSAISKSLRVPFERISREHLDANCESVSIFNDPGAASSSRPHRLVSILFSLRCVSVAT